MKASADVEGAGQAKGRTQSKTVEPTGSKHLVSRRVTSILHKYQQKIYHFTQIYIYIYPLTEIARVSLLGRFDLPGDKALQQILSSIRANAECAVCGPEEGGCGKKGSVQHMRSACF